MAKGNRRFEAADQAVVVEAILGGATIAAAARAAGFAVQTLYDCRNRCALFREAWDAAVEESGRPMLVAPGPGRRWQVKRMRRNRFTRERQELYLAHFAATCDHHASAEAAGVSENTVYDHRRRDPVFREAWQEALAQGYARLEAEVLRQRLAAMEKLRVAADPAAAPELAKMVADEFERAICLLREYRRSLDRPGGAGREPTKWSFEAAFAALEKELTVFGLRLERGEAWDDDEEDDLPA
jgi:transposase-like protein